MARRIGFIAVLVAAFAGLASLPVAAQSGRTFYIDYVSGSNSNTGTQAAPWKTHPYMQSSAACTGSGSAPAYSHQAGDRFLFKGGVSWPAACFQMLISSGGTSVAVDYYGADVTWFSGGSFTRPLFDLNYAVPSGDYVVQSGSGVGYLTFDNLEIAHQSIQGNGASFPQGCGMQFINGNRNGVTVKNSFLHDWVTNANMGSGFGGSCAGGISFANLVDNVEISDANGYGYINGTKTNQPWGGGCVNCIEVRNSKLHDGWVGCFTVNSCHDNEFYHIYQNSLAIANLSHTQVIEDDNPCNGPYMMSSLVYNNVVHDNHAGVNIFVKYNSIIYNNVMWNNTNNYQINLCTSSADSSSQVGYVVNNTLQCNSACVGTGSTFQGTLNLINNHYVTNGDPLCFNKQSCGTVTLKQSNNVTMSVAQANSQGYTALNRYQPTQATGGTVNAGMGLNNMCSGALTSLCTDILGISRGSQWNAGAYEFAGLSSKPNAPTALSAVVQ